MTDAARRLLLVHAHPDDECINHGATMAKYVAEGCAVTLVTCTGGERGEILVPELEHLAWDRENRLGEHRRGELADAMEILGVTDFRFLGGFGTYSDSGMSWHPDGHAVAADLVSDRAFWHADLTEASDHLVAVIREVRPQVLITYDQFGGYGHPDHIQAHRVATYAADLAAVPSYRPELGAPWDIAKIYWGAIADSQMREGLRSVRAAGNDEVFAPFDPEGALPPFVVADELVSTVIDAGAYASQKLNALRAHRTQVTEDSDYFAFSRVLGDQVLGVEHFRIAKGAPADLDANGVEVDLFAGLGPND